MCKSRKVLSQRLKKALFGGLLLVACVGVRANVEAALAGHEVIRLWPGAAPGTEDWAGKEFTGKRSVTNVTVPTLTAFYPESGHANGRAAIVCPGGGFTGLAIIEEGTMVAEWLAERGITAFVLKYRVRHSAFAPASAATGDDFDQRAKALESGRKIAAADAMQAIRVLRSSASKYKIDPSHIGMMGFSAGAMTTMSVVMEGKTEDLPDFAASVYGAMPGKNPPANAPPLFIVHAEDDPVVPPSKSIEMYSRWSAAGFPVELHVFDKGGHGFGAVRRNQPTDRWMSIFEGWLLEQGWIESAK